MSLIPDEIIEQVKDATDILSLVGESVDLKRTGSDWIAMDPTFGQDIADPTHIKFADGQSDPDGLREAGMVAAALIGDMELQVLSYVTVSGQKKTF